MVLLRLAGNSVCKMAAALCSLETIEKRKMAAAVCVAWRQLTRFSIVTKLQSAAAILRTESPADLRNTPAAQLQCNDRI